MLSCSRGGLGVDRWSDNRLHSASVDQIPLWKTIPTMSMFYVYVVPTPTDVCYKYLVLPPPGFEPGSLGALTG